MMRFSLLVLLIGLLGYFADSEIPATVQTTCGEQKVGPEPLKLTPEQEKVVAVAEEYLKKANLGWERPIEVKRPPNRVNVLGSKKYAEDEKHIWKVVYETPEKEEKRLAARTLFVNMRTNEVIPSVRK